MGVYIWLNRFIGREEVDKKLEKIAFGYRASWWYKLLFPFKEIPFEPKDIKYFRFIVNCLNASFLPLIVIFILSNIFDYHFSFVAGFSFFYILFYGSINKIYINFEKDLKHMAIDKFEAEGRCGEADDIKESMKPF